MKPTKKEAEEYLDELRKTGEINMYSAVPYLVSKFEIHHKVAEQFLLVWMKEK